MALDLFNFSNESLDQFINYIDTWVKIEDTEESKEMTHQEAEAECFNGDRGIEEMLTEISGATAYPDVEEKDMTIDMKEKEVEIVLTCSTLIGIQECIQQLQSILKSKMKMEFL